MTDEQSVGGETLASPGVGDEPESWAAAGGPEPDVSPQGSDPSVDTQRPELLIGAAFGGAFLFAKLLKRLGH